MQKYSYWKSFIKYVINTRKIQTIYVSNELEEISNYLKENFTQIKQIKYQYKDNYEILKQQEKKYKKSKKLYNRIIRKIKNLSKKLHL